MNAFAKLSVATLLAAGLVQFASAQFSQPAGTSGSLGGNTTDFGCMTVDIGGTYEMGGGTIQNAGALVIQSGGDLDAAGSLELGSDVDIQGSIDASQSNVTLNGLCAAPGVPIKVAGTAVFSNLTITSTTGQSFEFQPGVSITVTGTLTVTGTAGNPLTLISANGQPINIILAPGAQVVQSNVNLVNVNLGVPKPPTSVAAVPGIGTFLAWILSLLLFAVSFRGLRTQRDPINPRTQP
ncbi:hypothetical protein G7047_09550 [Diaphorobacter sp. HDW4A]|uniref:hypothetical protein n=1 Tax=Diaphorobacter sp. HDW4A TaxID=2714924 RepID=UPI00140A464E|nr:hypothetical protein [Diaphorobacter sp. HDW4A]QIL80121.1 hypothetical protein G7047_09550 [Diaphorobacter sp. HDW4A]